MVSSQNAAAIFIDQAAKLSYHQQNGGSISLSTSMRRICLYKKSFLKETTLQVVHVTPQLNACMTAQEL